MAEPGVQGARAHLRRRGVRRRRKHDRGEVIGRGEEGGKRKRRQEGGGGGKDGCCRQARRRAGEPRAGGPRRYVHVKCHKELDHFNGQYVFLVESRYKRSAADLAAIAKEEAITNEIYDGASSGGCQNKYLRCIARAVQSGVEYVGKPGGITE